MNAKQELLSHIGDRTVTYVHIVYEKGYRRDRKVISGTLDEVLPLLDFEYDNGYGGQELFGNIWYADGTWSDRDEYDGSEWWSDRSCPPIPDPRAEDLKMLADPYYRPPCPCCYDGREMDRLSANVARCPTCKIEHVVRETK